jgi:hypothetical protein
MSTLPSRNFTRFVLTLFILLCLVMRTAYQGKQFEFMLQEMRPKDVETIDEMIARNFTFYADPDFFQHYLSGMDFIGRFAIEIHQNS